MKKLVALFALFAAGDVTVSLDAGAIGGASIKVRRLARTDAKSLPTIGADVNVAVGGNTIVAALGIGDAIIIERSDVTAAIEKDCLQLKQKEQFSA